jgi:phage baseplate assembly protein V
MSVREVLRQIVNLIESATVTGVNDSTGQQEIQVGMAAGETVDTVEHYQPYGFSSVPPAESEAIVLSLNGDRGYPVAVVVSDRSSRPTGGQPGEVRVYHPDGAVIALLDNGDIHISCKAGGRVFVDDGVGPTGELATKADVDAMRAALHQHEHTYQTQGGPAITTNGPLVPSPTGTTVLEAK